MGVFSKVVCLRFSKAFEDENDDKDEKEDNSTRQTSSACFDGSGWRAGSYLGITLAEHFLCARDGFPE